MSEPVASSVTVRAPAKINLHLGVGPRRPDGFHPLATVYQAVGLYDDVTVSDQPDWSVHLRGDDRVDLLAVPADETNVALRAGRALAEHHGRDTGPGGAGAARIEIHKAIPVAGGMAGGSADAAATLVALDRLWGLGTPDEELLAIAAGLGSDVPFALLGGTAVGVGRGELVSPLADAGEWWWVVVGAEEGLSTPAVYRRYDELAAPVTAAPADPDVPDAVREALARGDVGWLAAALHNDLQEPALDLRPDLVRALDHGRDAGALAGLLSGSGPTVLLLAADRAHAHALHLAMADRGHRLLSVVPAPVAGAHVVSYG